ncbi:MAG: hypothetical protein H6563_02475 [Lewinellaceae bacterium]|nr:hypothetical protein [Lewinellaceae bacterium]
MNRSKKVDWRIILLYLFVALLAWGIPYLVVTLTGNPTNDFGKAIADILLMFYSVFGFLVLAVLSSAAGWYFSKPLVRKRTFAWVLGASALTLLIFLASTVQW